jgi:MFS family permease
MSNPYSEIFRAPGARLFSATGFIARLPLSMITLGIVTMLSQVRGEYWLAGAVAATFAFSNAMIAPQISRLVDRYGQRRVIRPASAISVAGLIALMLATRYDAPVWTLFLSAVLGGFMPSIGAMVRARWSEIYRNTPNLHTAFAFESVADEVIFMTGPIIAIGLSVSLFPEAGPLVATILLAIGTVLFAAQTSTEPPIHVQEASARSSVVRLPVVQIVALTLVAIGAIFGTAEVTAIAFSEEQGFKAAASLVLASYAAGSLIVGLIYGAMKLKMPLALQFVFAIALATLTTLPLLIIDSIPALAIVLFFAGAAVSPTIIISIGLIERGVPQSKLTEGITWAVTGIGVGMAVGSSASGWVIDEFGARNGFLVSIAAGFVALAIAAASYRVLAAKRAGSLHSAVPAE